MNLRSRAIVRAFSGILVEARTRAGRRIFTNRLHPVWQEELPAIVVHEIEEEISERDVAPRVLDRKLRLAVLLFYPPNPPKAGNPPREVTADELLDELGEEVEAAARYDQTLLGTAQNLILTGTQKLEVQPLPEVVLALGRMVYEVDYATDEPEGPDVRALFDLEEVRLRWGPKDDPRASEDQLKLERPKP